VKRILAVILTFGLLSGFAQDANPRLDSLLLELESASDTNRFNVLYELNYEYISSDLDKAQSYAIQALSYAKEIEFETGIIKGTQIIGNTFFYRNQYDKAIEKFTQANELAVKADDKELMGATYNSIAVVNLYSDELEGAVTYFKKSLDIKQAYSSNKDVANVMMNLGEAFRLQRELDSAMHYFNQCYQIMKLERDYRGLSHILNNIGNVYANQDEHDEALKYFTESFNYKKEFGTARDLAIACNNLGELHTAIEDYYMAIEYLLKGEEYALESESLEDIKMVYRGLAKVYELQGDWKNGLEAHQNYTLYKDSIYSTEMASTVAELKIKYKSEDKDRENELLKAQNEQEQAEINAKAAENDKLAKEKEAQFAIILGAILVLALLAVLIVFVLRANQNRRKDNKILYQKNKEITDSIRYAKRIQKAILPSNDVIKRCLPESFVFYKPKDIVAGDFYWMEEMGDKVLFAVADCTGHGVPGAMVSVVCHNALNRAVKEFGLIEPAAVLNKVNDMVIEAFEMSDDEVKDGMDIALCMYDRSTRKLAYAGANNPLYILHKEEFKEYKADRQPIGVYGDRKPFTNTEVDVQEGSSIYIFSDGYIDQFGGPKYKKFKKRQFIEMIQKMQPMLLPQQKKHIGKRFKEWKGDLEQIDDVCVIGVRV